MKKGDISVVSLFSGCGGLDLGFEGNFSVMNNYYSKHPFKVIFANDIMPQSCETIKLNFKDTNVICGDIKSILDTSPEIIPNADIVIGGFPCQDFSFAGKRLGLNSKRGNLYQEMKRVIELIKPKIFIAENVKGLVNFGPVLNKIIEDFSNSNPKYRVDHKLLMAADYGVPQSRERVIIVGVREDIAEKAITKEGQFSFPYPKPICSAIGNSLKKWITAKEAIEDLDNENIGLDRQDQFSKAKNYGLHLQGNKAIDADKIAPTIRAEHHGNIEFHYKNHRRLSVRECARIQTFPDNFSFDGSMSKAYVQIGNAVPPVLGWHIADSVKKFLSEYDH